jgi:hypothetical protein
MSMMKSWMLQVLLKNQQMVRISGGTNQTIIWLIEKISLFEIKRYLINLCQTIQIIQKGDFWAKIYDF